MQRGVAFSRTATLGDAVCLTQGRMAALATSYAHDGGGCDRQPRAGITIFPLLPVSPAELAWPISRSRLDILPVAVRRQRFRAPGRF